MNNTDKLLRAFIEASGYEIKRTVTHNKTPITKQSGEARIHQIRGFGGSDGLAHDGSGSYKRGDDECYYLVGSTDIDYKVTKKPVDIDDDIKQILSIMEGNNISLDDVDQAYNWGLDENIS